MSGGAIEHVCMMVSNALLERAAAELDCASAELTITDGEVTREATAQRVSVTSLLGGGPCEAEHEFHHRATQPLGVDGQGDAMLSLMFAAHRAVVDVDPELGLVRVVQVTTGQDVGKALNPVQVTGQIEGGIAQGIGLAVMEEIVLDDGRVRNPSFTDYLIPTALDTPDVVATLIEEPEPGAPFGAKGVGEPPTISSGPAVAAAIRAATGVDVNRVPVRPQDLALGR
jgi:CO/xanthine dehydrogenase Mo-binding subunit